ncbi:MAG: aminotransferase class III-fold pyridoxal phosphate-dependent enzyme [Phycisphaerae bacterium]|nr:aminotransferase class III-fold pyridoxal phosphate-dependent enzyme [Phycisphaerae bacterium]
MSAQQDRIEAGRKVLIENYGRLPIVAASGQNAKLLDADGKEYIDFFPGFGACGVTGHCHPAVVRAVQTQAATLQAHGNLLFSDPQIDLAERITKHAFGGKVFFCHSGAEANEAALKLVRLAARGGERKAAGPYKIISFENCFHGRTMGGLSITPPSFQLGFEPMLPGNVMVPYGDLAAVEKAVDKDTAGVFIEPIQAEGGMNIPTVEFMQGLRKLCDDKGLLLVCDEVWCGPARTGKWFAYQYYDIEPDVMTLAKAVGGGLPIAACVAAPQWADVLCPGTHGCTMGGAPVCAAAGAATMKLIEDENLVARAETLGNEAMQILQKARPACVTDLRGKGLMIGMTLAESVSAKDVMTACLDHGLIVCTAKNNVLRLAPPLTIETDVLHKGLAILIDVLKSKN